MTTQSELDANEQNTDAHESAPVPYWEDMAYLRKEVRYAFVVLRLRSGATIELEVEPGFHCTMGEWDELAEDSKDKAKQFLDQVADACALLSPPPGKWQTWEWEPFPCRVMPTTGKDR